MNEQDLLLAFKKQSLELEKRGQIIMKYEEEMDQLKENVLIISAENKKLEAMLRVAREERLKFLEDNENLERELKIKKAKLEEASL